jgi:hypothetical protein
MFCERLGKYSTWISFQRRPCFEYASKSRRSYQFDFSFSALYFILEPWKRPTSISVHWLRFSPGSKHWFHRLAHSIWSPVRTLYRYADTIIGGAVETYTYVLHSVSKLHSPRLSTFMVFFSFHSIAAHSEEIQLTFHHRSLQHQPRHGLRPASSDLFWDPPQ